jgi:poly(A) polymerase
MPDRLPLPVDDPCFAGARTVVDMLRAAGHQAWLVGGAVRDLLMGASPPDWDVATSATPQQVQSLFRKTVPVGVQFGVVRVRLKGFEYEVATFRADLGYTDGRRPDAVRFTDLAEDVRRRDFTINGLALDPRSGEVIDRVGGVEDLRAGLIRAIGDADARFAEDRLRPLRAVRFAARTGFAIEAGTWEAVRRAAADVAGVSAERIADELGKMLRSGRPGTGWRLLEVSGIRTVVLPEATADGEVVAGVLDALPGADLETAWAAALWPLGPEAAASTLRRLRCSNAMQRAVASVAGLGRTMEALPDGDVPGWKRALREPRAADAVRVLGAWRAATGQDDAPVRAAEARRAAWSGADLNPPRLAGGHEALAAGIPSGPDVARALVALEDAQLRGDVRDAEGALAFLRRFPR